MYFLSSGVKGLNRVVTANLLLSSPSNHIIFTDFLCFHGNANLFYMYHFCFEYGNAWSSLNRVCKRLQHVLLDRVANFISLYLEQGQGFIESAKLPYPNSC